jgi:hypothetical protein
MEQKDISITFCDDCMDLLDVDNNVQNDSIRVRRRNCIYYCSTVFSIVFLGLLFIWCYVIIAEMDQIDEMEEKHLRNE